MFYPGSLHTDRFAMNFGFLYLISLVKVLPDLHNLLKLCFMISAVLMQVGIDRFPTVMLMLWLAGF